MTAPLPSIAAGRSTPAAARYPELASPEWWRKHGHESNLALSKRLGCSHEWVRTARQQMGVPAFNRGRDRGQRPPDLPSPIDGLTQFERRLIDRLRADRRSAATEQLLIARLRSAHDAKLAGDQLGYEAAMFAVSTVAARIAEHEQQLRKAA